MKSMPTFALNVAGSLAPSLVAKRDVLTMDGQPRFVTLDKGIFTIYEDAAGAGQHMLSSPMKFVEIVGNTATPATAHLPRMADNEFRLTVEPEALNRAVMRNRGSMPHGRGFGVGMVGIQSMMTDIPQTTELTGDVKRVVVSLFAATASDKLAWTALLTSTASGLRSWAHCKHEAATAASGAKDTLRGAGRGGRPAQSETVLVTIPPGARPGQSMTVQTSGGPMTVQVPAGASPGQQFNMNICAPACPRRRSRPE
jgi:hypothetical protein